MSASQQHKIRIGSSLSLKWIQNCNCNVVLASIIGCIYLLQFVASPLIVEAVVVDGTRKGPSALAEQSNQEELIDGYNTKTCGLFDTDDKQSGFVNSAREGQFPWLVSFQVKKNDGSLAHFCMGSFISDRWILTAAHCFADP